MKRLTITATITLLLAIVWTTHLPSPNPINGSFLAMLAAGAFTAYQALTMEERTR